MFSSVFGQTQKLFLSAFLSVMGVSTRFLWDFESRDIFFSRYPSSAQRVVGPLNSLIKNGYDYITLTPSAKTLHTWLGSSPPCLPVKLALALHRAERARCLRDAPAQLYDCCCAQQIPTWRLLLPWIWCALEPPFSWQSECLSVAQSIPTRLLVAVGLCRSARSVLSAPEPRTPCTSVGGHLLC